MCGGASLGVGLLGAGMSALGALSKGYSESSAYNQNATVSEQNAEIIKQKGAYDVYLQQQRANSLQSEGRVAALKSGGTLSGSSLDVLADSAARAEMDKQALQYNTNIDVMSNQSQASMFKAEAKKARMMGWMGAGSALLAGLSPFAQFGGGGMKATKAMAPETGRNTFMAGDWGNGLERFKPVNGRYLKIGGA